MLFSAALTATLLLVGCGTGDHPPVAAPSTTASVAPTGSGSASAPPSASSAAARTYFAQYGTSTHAYKPRRLNPSVDGSLYVRQVHWQVWNSHRAVGRGIAHVNDCMPDCADGHYTTYRVTVQLSRPRELCGSRFFLGFRLTGSGYRTSAHWFGVGCR
jgi:hypothetical protein